MSKIREVVTIEEMEPKQLPSEENIRLIYRCGEEAVVVFVDSMTVVVRALSERVQVLEDHLAKNIRNTGKPPSSTSREELIFAL